MRLKELRHKKVLTQKEMAKAMSLKGVDEALYNKIERGKCLPTPTTLRMMEHILDAKVEEMYDYNEIDLVSGYPDAKLYQAENKARKHRQAHTQEYTMFCVRVKSSEVKGLNRHIFQTVGYNSQTEWLRTKINELWEEYKKVQDKGGSK